MRRRDRILVLSVGAAGGGAKPNALNIYHSPSGAALTS